MRLLYIHILYIYIGVRIIYCNAVYDTYSDVYVRICMYMPSYEQYMAVTATVYACISGLYLHIPPMGRGDPCQYMSVYACIYVENTCIYISPYMYVYPAVFLYVFPTVYLSVFLYVYPAVFLALGHGAVTVASHSPAPARGRCTFAARSLRQVCRAAAHGTSQNSIRSGLRDRTAAASGNLYRRALKCHCALKCHGNLGWRSFTR